MLDACREARKQMEGKPGGFSVEMSLEESG